MSIPDSALSEGSISSTEPLGRTLNSWTQIKFDDGLAENVARAQIQSQVQSLIRSIRLPWKTVESTPQPVETMVIDVLQQELDDALYPDEYRTACMKCLRELCKARNEVPSSLFLRDVTREGENPVGGGGFADIWKGRRHDTQVCLKVLRVFGTEEEKAKVLRDFCQEALVWRQLRHRNVLPFMGVSKNLFAPRYCLISPWIVNGNIMSYLEAHPDHDRLASLVQIAEGMKYLHSLNPPIVHADIRGANIFVTDDLRCCLADFGLSLFAESQALESSSRMRKGCARWLAPEYIDANVVIDRAYVTARDVYAYGCTVVEIFTGKPPFSDIRNEAAVIHAVIAGKRPLRPQHLLQDGLWSLVMACLTASPSERPNAKRISKVLAGPLKHCQQVIEERNITTTSRRYDNDAALQGASEGSNPRYTMDPSGADFSCSPPYSFAPQPLVPSFPILTHSSTPYQSDTVQRRPTFNDSGADFGYYLPNYVFGRRFVYSSPFSCHPGYLPPADMGNCFSPVPQPQSWRPAQAEMQPTFSNNINACPSYQTVQESNYGGSSLLGNQDPNYSMSFLMLTDHLTMPPGNSSFTPGNHRGSDAGIDLGIPKSFVAPYPQDIVMDNNDGLIKPRYQPVQIDEDLPDVGQQSVSYYVLDPPDWLHQCSIDLCTEMFRVDKIHDHLRNFHVQSMINTVTCRLCSRTMEARFYEEHYKDEHSGRELRCAYCHSKQSRVEMFSQHFHQCQALSKFQETWKNV